MNIGSKSSLRSQLSSRPRCSSSLYIGMLRDWNLFRRQGIMPVLETPASRHGHIVLACSAAWKGLVLDAPASLGMTELAMTGLRLRLQVAGARLRMAGVAVTLPPWESAPAAHLCQTLAMLTCISRSRSSEMASRISGTCATMPYTSGQNRGQKHITWQTLLPRHRPSRHRLLGGELQSLSFPPNNIPARASQIFTTH